MKADDRSRWCPWWKRQRGRKSEAALALDHGLGHCTAAPLTTMRERYGRDRTTRETTPVTKPAVDPLVGGTVDLGPVEYAEAMLDELYGVELGEFIPTRKRLAKELKDAGEKDASAVLATVRKPTVAAWVLNQLARRERKQVDLLLDAGHRLGRAQAALLRGEGQASFDSARQAEQSALVALTKAARSLLQQQGALSQNTLNQIAESLRAAAVSEDGRQLLATGRFVKPFEGSGGFEALAAIAPAQRADESPQQKARAEETLRQAQTDLRSAKRRQRRLEQQLATAEQRHEKLVAELGKATARAEELRASIKDAAAETAEAERKLRQTK